MTTPADDRRLATRDAGARWKRHLANWKAYAVAGGAALATGTNADAQIVYATVNESIAGGGASSKFTFNVNGHGVFAAQTHQRGIGGSSFGTALIGGKAGVKFYGSHGLGLNYLKGAAIGKGSGNLGVPRWAFARFKRLPAGPGRPTAISDPLTGSTHGPRQFRVTLGSEQAAAIKDGSRSMSAPPAIRMPVWRSRSRLTRTIARPGDRSTPAIPASRYGAMPEPGTMALVLMAAGAAGLTSIRRARARVASETSAEAGVDRVLIPWHSGNGPTPLIPRVHSHEYTEEKSPLHWLGRGRLESHSSLDGRRQDAEPPGADRARRDGAVRDPLSAAVAHALDVDRHRQTAVQARHSRLLRAHARWPRHPANHQPFPYHQGHLEHPEPEWLPEHGDRLVAQPSRRADQRCHDFGPITTKHSGPSTRAGRCCRTRFIRPNCRRHSPNAACIRKSSCPR